MALTKSPTLNYERLQTFEAEADLSLGAYMFVILGATGVKAVTTAAEPIHGVLINGAKIGKACGVLTEYGTRVILKMGTTSASIPSGTLLTSDAKGAAVPAANNVALHHAIVCGGGITGAGAKAGQFVTALYIPNSKK